MLFLFSSYCVAADILFEDNKDTAGKRRMCSDNAAGSPRSSLPAGAVADRDAN